MEIWTEVRRRVLTGELSKRAVWIHEVLERDKTEPSKQRHTAKRIFDRLKAERGSSGGYTVVKDAVQKWKAATKEVFIPLSHPPGEAQVDFRFAGRANFLVPVPKVASLVELNEMLNESCRTGLQRQLWGKSGTKEAILTEERAAFLPPPAQECEARRVTQADASSLSLVQFDTNRYSVPVKYAHRRITVVATVDDVKLVFENQLIARHRRHWGRKEYFYDPIHYLALLEQSPGPSTMPGRLPTGRCPSA